MRTVSMCFSILRVPKFGVYTLANIWNENFHTANRNSGHDSLLNQFGLRIYNLEGGDNKRWTRKSVTTKAGGKSKTNLNSTSSDFRNEILEGSISTSCTISINKAEKSEIRNLLYSDIQETFTEKKDWTGPVTVLIFDIETTGLSREGDRIVEIAFQDLSGGENSTFQTLVNPECYISNAFVHGITNRMVDRPDVPRMEELIPILLKFVRSRQKPGGCVILVAHNARTFDVPFLRNEFSRHSFDFPEDWRFLDTLPLARESVKASSGGSKASTSTTLKATCKRFEIAETGTAHRAMSDVRSLSLVLQRLTFDLKLSVSDLVERSFIASDLMKKKKK